MSESETDDMKLDPGVAERLARIQARKVRMGEGKSPSSTDKKVNPSKPAAEAPASVPAPAPAPQSKPTPAPAPVAPAPATPAAPAPEPKPDSKPATVDKSPVGKSAVEMQNEIRRVLKELAPMDPWARLEKWIPEEYLESYLRFRLARGRIDHADEFASLLDAMGLFTLMMADIPAKVVSSNQVMLQMIDQARGELVTAITKTIEAPALQTKAIAEQTEAVKKHADALRVSYSQGFMIMLLVVGGSCLFVGMILGLVLGRL